MSDVCLSVSNKRSDIKMTKQELDLSQLTGIRKGKNSNAVPIDSFFVLRDNRVIYVAVNSKSGYTSAIVVANEFKRSKKSKNENQVNDEIDKIDGAVKIYRNTTSIRTTTAFNVSRRFAKNQMKKWHEYEQSTPPESPFEIEDKPPDPQLGMQNVRKRSVSEEAAVQPGSNKDRKTDEFNAVRGRKRILDKGTTKEDTKEVAVMNIDEEHEIVTRKKKKKDDDVPVIKDGSVDDDDDDEHRSVDDDDDDDDDGDDDNVDGKDRPKDGRLYGKARATAVTKKNMQKREDKRNANTPRHEKLRDKPHHQKKAPYRDVSAIKDDDDDENDDEDMPVIKDGSVDDDDEEDVPVIKDGSVDAVIKDKVIIDKDVEEQEKTEKEGVKKPEKSKESEQQKVEVDMAVVEQYHIDQAQRKKDNAANAIKSQERRLKVQQYNESLLQAAKDKSERENQAVVEETNDAVQSNDVEEALGGSLPVVEDPHDIDTSQEETKQSQPSTVEDPHDIDTSQEETKQSQPSAVPSQPITSPPRSARMQSRQLHEEKRAKELAEEEAARIVNVNPELANGAMMEQVIRQEQRQTQSDTALSAAAGLRRANRPQLTTHMTDQQLEGGIDFFSTRPLTERQKAAALGGPQAISTPVKTPSGYADGDIGDAVDASVKEGLQTKETRAESNKQGAAQLEFGQVNQNTDNEQRGTEDISSDQSGVKNPMNYGGQSRIASSANASEAVTSGRKRRIEQDAILDDLETQRQQAEDEEDNPTTPERTGRTQEEATSSELEKRESEKMIDQILGTTSGEIAAGDVINEELHEDNEELQEENDRLQELVEDYATKLELARKIKVQQMAPPSDEENRERLAHENVRQRAQQDDQGQFPNFDPTQAFEEIYKMKDDMQGLLENMTMIQAQFERTQMEPWWLEYQNARQNQAVHDMERTPSRIIESSVGSVQLSNKIEEGTSEEEKQFYNFMYWMMRNKMDHMETMTHWKDFWTYAKSMNQDISQARLYWLISGNPDANTTGVDYEGMDYSTVENSTTAGSSSRTQSTFLVRPGDVGVVTRTISGTPLPQTGVPNRNTSPSAQAATIQREYKIVDGKLVALTDMTRTLEEAGNKVLTGLPSKVSNIPDPRFSERGGVNVPNVRIVTRRNPDYIPGQKDSKEFIHSGDAPAGPNDKFQNVNVADVGAGAHEIGAQIDKAEGDRLTASLPFKLYAPIHAQAVDRYLGEKNYARLNLAPVKYFKQYAQQPFKPEDIQKQFNWNSFVMTVYGPMLYAFVTDKDLVLTAPRFNMRTPKAVTMEFMELNELIDELERYQSKSVDRSSRVGDSAVAQEPIEKHLSDFFHGRDNEEQDKMADSNVAMIALPNQGGKDDGKGGGDTPVPPRPGGGGDKPDDKPKVRFGLSSGQDTTTLGFGEKKDLSSLSRNDIDYGVRRAVTDTTRTAILTKEDKVELRSNIFRRFNR